MPETANGDFAAMRREAEATLRKVLAPPAHPDDGMAHVNVESTRAQAMARLDCLCVQWLDQAFQEVDRVQRWVDLRAQQVQVVLNIHAPVEVEQNFGPMEANWLPPLICGECQVAFPCRTRESVLQGPPN